MHLWSSSGWMANDLSEAILGLTSSPFGFYTLWFEQNCCHNIGVRPLTVKLAHHHPSVLCLWSGNPDMLWAARWGRCIALDTVANDGLLPLCVPDTFTLSRIEPPQALPVNSPPLLLHSLDDNARSRSKRSQNHRLGLWNLRNQKCLNCQFFRPADRRFLPLHR
jgi:hypothetical protein